MKLIEKLRANLPVLLYGLTPPRLSKTPQEAELIAQRQLSRLEGLNFDGLVVYDLQDESDRAQDRPFEFSGCYAPERYYKEFLKARYEAVLYKAVSHLSHEKLAEFLHATSANPLVFVGAASSKTRTLTSLSQAYETKKALKKNGCLGGIAISERHSTKFDEDHRVAKKILGGCEFFVTQAVFDAVKTKKFLDDYAMLSIKKVPIIFTFTPIGSFKSLEFIKWLGVSIPKFVEEQIFGDGEDRALERSARFCTDVFKFLRAYADAKGIVVGANIESISTKKSEIECSLELLKNFAPLVYKGFEKSYVEYCI